MKNRPVAAEANKYKDVYGSQSKPTRTALTAVLILLMIVFIVMSVVHANWFGLGIFGTVLVALVISLIVGHHADRCNAPVDPTDSSEAIFREHDI